MIILTESAYIESKSIRDTQVASLSDERAEAILNKVKSLYFALWKGEGIATTEEMAEFFEVEAATIRKVLVRHKEELASDGVETLRGKALKEVRDIVSLSSNQSRITIWTPRAALRLGMLLRDSETAKIVRTSLLNAVEKVIPAQVQQESKNLNLPSPRERLENIRLGLELFSELGGCDERTQVQLKDQVRNILLADKLQPSPSPTEITNHPPRLEYPVSDRAIDLGYRPKFEQLLQIGKRVKKLYVERHGTEPIKREQFVGGATRMVNVYGFADLDLLDEAIALVMDKK